MSTFLVRKREIVRERERETEREREGGRERERETERERERTGGGALVARELGRVLHSQLTPGSLSSSLGLLRLRSAPAKARHERPNMTTRTRMAAQPAWYMHQRRRWSKV